MSAADPAPPVVSARGVAVSYGETRALDGVDLEVAPGQVHGLIGMNGSGKSTLFKALMGLVRAEAGAVELFGGSPAARPARRCGSPTRRRARTSTGTSRSAVATS